MLIFMNNPAASRILWNEAAGKGFLLGLFTFLCRILSQSITLNGPSSGTAVLGIVIWFIQFAGCIWLMKVFMERLAAKYDGVDNKDTARYGMRLALASSIVFSAGMLADILFIAPEIVEEQMDMYYRMYGQYMDTNTQAMFRKVEDSYPEIVFFSTLTYSFLYGVVLSRILSMSIPKKDPFSSFMDKQEK